MNLLELPWLSLALWLPALGALLLLVLPVGRQAVYRQVALGFSGATFAITVGITWLFVTGPYGPLGPNGAVVGPPLQFTEQLNWIPAFGAQYSLGLDGINLWMIVLTSLLTPIAVAATWSRHIRPTRTMMALLLVMETGLMGAFLAQDMLLFYVFFEATLIPAVLLVGMWGGEGHTRAATRLFLYTFAASVLMLIGIIALSVLHRNAIVLSEPAFRGTFELSRIVADLRSGAFVIDPTIGRLIFGAFFIAFAVKMALWPFHTWLPDAYAAAPTPVAILLAGVMSKFGAYGLIRFNLTLFPEFSAWAAPAVGILAVIGLIYAAVIAFSQQDLTRVIAYASISHMNMIALGIFALNSLGIDGAVFQMVAHGVTTAALLVIVAVLFERREVRELSSFGGLWAVMPKFAGLTLLVLLALIGFPGLSGFAGEFALMQGVYTSSELGAPFAVAGVIGVILAAAYGLRIFQRAFMGEVDNVANQDLPDLNRRELLTLGVLAAAIVVVGLFPNLLFAPLGGTVEGLVAALGNNATLALLP